MANIAQKVRSITTRTMIIATLVPIGLLAISSAQAAKPSSSSFCPCFSSTIIDATIAEGGGSGLGGVLEGGSFFCEDSGDVVNLRINNAGDMNISVFGETFAESPGPGCGWSGRPLDTTIQEARECQNQIKESWAWEVLGCPKPR